MERFSGFLKENFYGGKQTVEARVEAKDVASYKKKIAAWIELFGATPSVMAYGEIDDIDDNTAWVKSGGMQVRGIKGKYIICYVDGEESLFKIETVDYFKFKS